MKKTIGIIGGMGPMATVDLFGKIVANTQAACDGDQLRVLIDNNTAIPDRSAAILSGGESPLPQMQKSARLLEQMGADLLVIACNTAHHYYKEIAGAVSIPVLDMIAITLEECIAQGYTCAGLLSTTGTVKAGVYGQVFSKSSCRCILSDEEEQGAVMEAIYKYKADSTVRDTGAIAAAAEQLRDRGAQAIILGCTELPLIASAGPALPLPLLDPTLLLARRAIREAGGKTI